MKYPITGYLTVRFEDRGLHPDEEKFLTDESPQTCTAFNITNNAITPRYTQFRIYIAYDQVGEVNVTLIGTNLGCGHNMYVTPLSAAEIGTWTGKWSICPLKQTSSYEDKETCSYECRCSGICKEIQIMKYPASIKDSSWSVCHICIDYEPGKTRH